MVGQSIPDWQIIYTMVTRALIIMGSSVNPIVYSFMGQNFRNHLAESVQLWRKTFTRFVGRGRQHMSARLSVTLQQQQAPGPKTPTTLSTKTTGGGNGIEGALGKSPMASVTV
ncbi:uncharacterized protein LOC142355364 [Convolutriloba macropyga]|uniref:uncharacterized protein LOC142355364 n=1 Tax=Convolutriloba macropyga TaxID=536237 RepID=UPI003F5269B9